MSRSVGPQHVVLSFQEHDVYPRTCGAHRDAYRIVVDLNTGEVWYSPDHYIDFYHL